MLWDEYSHSMALAALGALETQYADEEILRFAFSQAGNLAARLNALFLLKQFGRYTGPAVVKIWDEEQKYWREVELSTQQIGDVSPNAQPKTLELIEKAHRVKDPNEAIRIMQKAVEHEPTSPIAVFNLGVLLVQNGREEEGTKLLYHSIEVDPNYMYGHASIALAEAEKGNEREALDHLEIISQASVIAPETAVIVNLARTVLALAKRDVKSARQSLELAAQILPDHRLIEGFEERVREEEEIHEKFGFIIEYQRRSAQRAHEKHSKIPLHKDMRVAECLEMHTKDMLTGSARFLGLRTSGKKGQMISAQVQYLLGAEILLYLFTVNLKEKEREALIWLLEMDGIRPWMEFIRKFGDDSTESTGWNYHEPESIPGRLKMIGLLFTGEIDGQQVAFIPADLRPLLQEIIRKSGKE
jgi:tetratricopeptide (TPR) repeat protein